MNNPNQYELCAGWLPNNPVIGSMYVERTRGAEVISFEYDLTWLKTHPNLILDPDIIPSIGRQYPSGGRSSFGFLDDISPDRWGRRLIERRERLDAVTEHRPVRTLLGSDFLLEVHDGGRLGGIRIRQNGLYLSNREDLAAPPMEYLRKLQDAAWNYENHSSDEDKWIRMLIAPGSSLGGARPKANLKDADGSIWIAKFPSRHDEINIGAWEMVTHDLAKICGLDVPEAAICRLSENGSTFLTKRFDRDGESRIHFASAMTMLSETDNSEKVRSYLDIADTLDRYGCSPQSDSKQLFRRVLFNILVSNTDDHLRNHGFLLQPNDTWKLSPAYDINPSLDKDHLSLTIDGQSCEKDISLVIATADYYGYTKSEAEELAQTMQNVISQNWRLLAEKYALSRSEREYMAPAFAEAERNIAISVTTRDVPPGMDENGLVTDLRAHLAYLSEKKKTDKSDDHTSIDRRKKHDENPER